MNNGELLNRLKYKRALVDLTQEELAKRVDVTRQTIIAIEKGKYAPSVLLALKLAKELKCQVEDIFYEKNV
ncbi:MAG: helix-turn-helix transcriptional regulator [Spirochaetales bacterium]|nr:helix-turn-helix transcriptional regulator [Spirochaetales bacterium]